MHRQKPKEIWYDKVIGIMCPEISHGKGNKYSTMDEPKPVRADLNLIGQTVFAHSRTQSTVSCAEPDMLAMTCLWSFPSFPILNCVQLNQ